MFDASESLDRPLDKLYYVADANALAAFIEREPDVLSDGVLATLQDMQRMESYAGLLRPVSGRGLLGRVHRQRRVKPT
jgi:hypothetical protein